MRSEQDFDAVYDALAPVRSTVPNRDEYGTFDDVDDETVARVERRYGTVRIIVDGAGAFTHHSTIDLTPAVAASFTLAVLRASADAIIWKAGS